MDFFPPRSEHVLKTSSQIVWQRSRLPTWSHLYDVFQSLLALGWPHLISSRTEVSQGFVWMISSIQDYISDAWPCAHFGNICTEAWPCRFNILVYSFLLLFNIPLLACLHSPINRFCWCFQFWDIINNAIMNILCMSFYEII